MLKPEDSSSLTGANVDFQFPIGEGSSVRVTNEGLLNFNDVAGDTEKEFIETAQNLISQKLDSLYYITDSRDIESWGADPQEQDFVGYRGENTVSMLHALRDNEEVFNDVVDAIGAIADKTDEVVADMHEAETMTEIVDADTGEKFNIVASGSGLRRLLPIIVQIAAMDDGSTLFLEEPEISVFPATQGRFLDYLIEEIQERNIQIVMTTHSWAFTRKLEIWINEHDSRDIGHGLYFEKENGETKVEKRALDRLGLGETWEE
jgi:predicted ATPase